MNIFRTFWKSAKDLFEDLFILGIINVLWILINAPFALLLLISAGTMLFYVALLLCTLTLGPTNAGLYTIAERVIEGRTSSWRNFFEGLRAHAALSWKIYGLWLLGLVVLLFNLQFYVPNNNTLSALLRVIFLYLTFVWFSLLIYIGPLMVLQTNKHIRIIARNAALMTFGRPIFTIVTLILMLVVVGASVWLMLPLIFATFSFLAIWSFRATLTLIAEDEARRQLRAEQEATHSSEKSRSGQARPRK